MRSDFKLMPLNRYVPTLSKSEHQGNIVDDTRKTYKQYENERFL